MPRLKSIVPAFTTEALLSVWTLIMLPWWLMSVLLASMCKVPVPVAAITRGWLAPRSPSFKVSSRVSWLPCLRLMVSQLTYKAP
ncbi:hypothetical protein D3C77_648690 [compost metagenome]